MLALARLIRAWFRACCAFSILGLALASASDSDNLRKRAEGFTESLGLQRDLPTHSHKADPQTIHDTGSGSWLGDADTDSLALSPSAFWGFLQWALLAIGAVVLLAFLGDWIAQEWVSRASSRASGKRSTPAASPTEIVNLEKLLDAAEQHAAASQHREALHYILSAALLILRSDASETRDSLTSRELIAAAKLQPVASGALRRLLSQVECAWFGQKPVSVDDYTTAVVNFRAFREAQWPAG